MKSWVLLQTSTTASMSHMSCQAQNSRKETLFTWEGGKKNTWKLLHLIWIFPSLIPATSSSVNWLSDISTGSRITSSDMSTGNVSRKPFPNVSTEPSAPYLKLLEITFMLWNRGIDDGASQSADDVAYPGYFTYSYCVNLRMCADNLILMAPLPIMVLSAKASRAGLWVCYAQKKSRNIAQLGSILWGSGSSQQILVLLLV